jgi:hypothetical protein
MPLLGQIVTLAPGAIPAAAVMVSNFSLQTQLHSQWCWAAVTSSICAMYGNANVTQCSLASAYFGDCCVANPQPDDVWPCNCANGLDVALSGQGHLAAGSPVSQVNNPVQPAQIAGEINNQRPVCCQIDFPGTSHFIVIVGYDPTTGDLIVEDPAITSNSGSYTFAGLSGFHGGTWSQTFFVAP